ncbi:type VI secretion system Vgr family protein [Chryseobacterium sp. ERMR1:04]|uniref:type VI secretion system Vgr family protein n=1 Tax=Chryseobacterium sp. ERMR1:04 TaxID=1705393 RepID=UPI0006C8E0EC|nr:phage baseplate assembly protein V [Chryseobacterium sp. ERMR1:04]KPH12909.1 Vgr family protein [Chryseobacterium sp. ERMR1:04]
MKNRNNENELISNEDYSKLRKPSFIPDNNAKGISANHIAGINRVVGIEVLANGKPIKHFKHFKLKQSAINHHEFEIILAHDSLENRQSQNLEDANKLLGKRFTTTFKYKDADTEDNPNKSFVGVITSVGFSREKTSLGDIVLKGYSPTILLDSAPHTQSFGGDLPVNMGIIANEVIKQGLSGSDFDFNIDTNDSSQILYSSQYDETHYNYLARMAEAYGEQFYYDGYVLHFGKLPAPSSKRIQLIEGSNVSDLNIEIKAVYTKPQFYGYNSSKNEKLTSGETPIKHLGDLAQTAYTNNDKIYKTPSLQVAPIKAATHLDVEYSQKSSSGSKAVDVMNVSGSTSIPFLHPGCVTDLKIRVQDSNQTRHLTTIMITETTHEVDARGYYKGSFEAISEGTGYMPKPEFHVPRPEPQIATVISNTDPAGQGRVTVRFDWQLNDTTDFIRMMSPDAGGTDQITQNRGYVAIPEVGDQVMVNFQHGHPDRPFVMGGMFHGGTGLGGGANNHMKSWQTKSGIKLLMNDNEGSVNIIDPSGNTYLMDGQGNIAITAPNNITFNAGGNLAINVGQNMTTTVEMNSNETVGINKSLNVGMMNMLTVGKDFVTNIIGKLNVVGQNMTTTVEMNSNETVGINKSLNVGMMNMLTVGKDFVTNIIGKLTHYVKGDMETFGEKEHKTIAIKGVEVSSENKVEHHAEKEIKNNSNEKSKNH